MEAEYASCPVELLFRNPSQLLFAVAALLRQKPGGGFYLFTDGEIRGAAPENVHIVPVTWEEMVRTIQAGFPFPVNISSPYKLTDFKPAYGYIFEELLRPYDYWGYCDVDLLFGRLMHFLREPMEAGREQIYRLGHLTLYRNTPRMRQMFMQKGGKFSYRTVYSTPECYSFDEHCGQMLICKKQGVDTYAREDMADISCRIKRLTASRQPNAPCQVFYYENGAVLRAWLDAGQVRTQEYVYIHVQKRRFQAGLPGDCFYILSDRFVPKQPGIPTEEELRRHSEFVSAEADAAQLSAFRKGKLKQFFASPLRQKWIWINQKLAERRFR